MPVIESLLDTDLYKFTMMQAVLHQHPGAHAEYRFRCRTPGIDLARHIDAISDEIDHLCTLRLADGELDYLRGLRFIKSDFVDFLALFRLQRKYVSLRRSKAEPGAIELEVKGPWLHTILFEVPLLAIVNEVLPRHPRRVDEAEGLRRLRPRWPDQRRGGYEDCRITDFGTRRRYSRVPGTTGAAPARPAGSRRHQQRRPPPPRPGREGTMAHEWLQAWPCAGLRLR